MVAFIVTLGLLWIVYKIAVPLVHAPIALGKFLWHNKIFTVAIVIIGILSAMFHNPGNTLNFNEGATGVIGYFLTGFANFFYGVWMGLGRLVDNLFAIHQKIWDSNIGGFENTGGYILAYIGYSVWAFCDAVVYWMMNFLLSVDFCVGVLGIFGLLVLLGGGGGGILGAAMTKGSGGGGGGHAKAGGGHAKH